jgi:hypothetical protein
VAKSHAPAMKYGVYDAYEVRSALRKEIKLGDLDAAMYWANVMISEGGTEGRANLAKQLFIMATEDCYGDAVYLRAAMTMQMQNKVGETDSLYFLVGSMCRAPKWWETEEGRAVDRAWARAIGDYRDPERRREIPPYALDRHTRRGWAIKRATGWWDDRFSGTTLGRAKTMWLFKRDGRLDPSMPFDHMDPGFVRFWRQYCELMGPEARQGEPNDPLGEAADGAEPSDDPCLFDSAEVGGEPDPRR